MQTCQRGSAPKEFSHVKENGGREVLACDVRKPVVSCAQERYVSVSFCCRRQPVFMAKSDFADIFVQLQYPL